MDALVGWAIVRASLGDRKHNTGWIRCGFKEFRDEIKEGLQEKRIREDNYFICVKEMRMFLFRAAGLNMSGIMRVWGRKMHNLGGQVELTSPNIQSKEHQITRVGKSHTWRSGQP